MNEMSELTIAILGLILAAWAGAAAWSIWSAMGLQRQARATMRQSGRLAKMLETAPAMPLLVRSDGKLEVSPRLMRWLGFDQLPSHLSELHQDDAGFSRADLTALTQDVALAQKSGQPFQRSVSVQGSDKILLIRGGLADPQIATNSGALLWIFDATDSESEIRRLREESETAFAAFDALSAVIESAPLPMWYRDDAGVLQLVNSAYVRATDANSAEAVIAEQRELIDDDSSGDAAQRTRRLIAAGQQVKRQQSVTIAGERRRMEVVELPIGDRGVAGYALDRHELENARHRLTRFGDAQRDMLDRMSAGVAQFDSDGSLAFHNLPFQRMFGLRQQWVAERPEWPRLLDRMRENKKLPEVRDFPEWRAEKQRWFQASEPVEENWVLPDGAHLRVVGHPAPDGGLLVVGRFVERDVQGPAFFYGLLGPMFVLTLIPSAMLYLWVERPFSLAAGSRSRAKAAAGE